MDADVFRQHIRHKYLFIRIPPVPMVVVIIIIVICRPSCVFEEVLRASRWHLIIWAGGMVSLVGGTGFNAKLVIL